jgi:hypothetical protein
MTAQQPRPAVPGHVRIAAIAGAVPTTLLAHEHRRPTAPVEETMTCSPRAGVSEMASVAAADSPGPDAPCWTHLAHVETRHGGSTASVARRRR